MERHVALAAGQDTEDSAIRREAPAREEGRQGPPELCRYLGEWEDVSGIVLQ